MKYLFIRKLWFGALILFLLNTSANSQETYEIGGLTESAFAKNLFHFSLDEITAKVPHLKTINLSFDLAKWYWTSNPSVFSATTYINVDIGKVIYGDFVMTLPNGADKRVSFQEIGIVPTSNPTICDIKLEVLLSKFDMTATAEIDIDIHGKGSGAVNFSEESKAFKEFVKFDVDKGRYKTVREIFNGLEPQVRITYNGSYNCNIGGFESNFYLQAINKYIEKEYAEVSLRMKLTSLMADAQNAESFGRIDEAIDKYNEAYKVGNDPEVKIKIDELLKLRNSKEAQELVERAKSEESLGNLASAESLYKQAFEKSEDPNIQKEIERVSAKITEQQKTDDNPVANSDLTGNEVTNSNKSSSNQQVERDFFGNPVKNSSSSNINTQRQPDPVPDYNAIRKKEIDDYNANILNQAQNVANRDIEGEIQVAMSKIDKGVYSSPESMMKTGMSIMNLAQNSSEVYTGAALTGVGIVSGIANDIAKAKAKREAAEERNRQRELAKAREKEIRSAIKQARMSLFSHFTNGELPVTSTPSMTQNLYYFVYAYNESEMLLDRPSITLSNVFAIGKYPDSTWPMKSKITENIEALTPLNEIMAGPYQTLYEATLMHKMFTDNMNKVSLNASNFNVDGFNAHAEDALTQETAPKVDFWGNPLDSSKVKEATKPKTESAVKVELDYWGNPIKKKGNN